MKDCPPTMKKYASDEDIWSSFSRMGFIFFHGRAAVQLSRRT
jgi:hypothetical protein